MKPQPAAQRGYSLIEVMVAVLIMGIGLLGIAAMQATALKNGQSSLERGQAVVQSYAILDAMRANRDRAIAGDYNLASMTCTVPSATGTLAQNDLNSWITALKNTLGSGAGNDTTTCGQINCVGDTPTQSNVCTVTVQWDDSRGSASAATSTGEGSAMRKVVTVGAL